MKELGKKLGYFVGISMAYWVLFLLSLALTLQAIEEYQAPSEICVSPSLQRTLLCLLPPLFCAAFAHVYLQKKEIASVYRLLTWISFFTFFIIFYYLYSRSGVGGCTAV
jgi:hypothetical protein